MRRFPFLVVVMVGFLALGLGGREFGPGKSPPVQPPRIPLKDSASLNWSGYADIPKSGVATQFSDVQGSWTQPAATCAKGSQYASFWVGIDGYSSNSVEQIGTDSDCYSGRPNYYAWYEMYPAASVRIAALSVHAGDSLAASVHYNGDGTFTLSLSVNGGPPFQTTQSAANAARSSAEWVAEAPSIGNHILPLANFGTVGFAKAQATGNLHNGPIDDKSWSDDPMTMVTSKGIVKAIPSALSGGSAFSVTWEHQ